MPRIMAGIPREVLRLAADHVLVATIEDGARLGGGGAALAQAVNDAGILVPVRTFGVTEGFPQQAARKPQCERAPGPAPMPAGRATWLTSARCGSGSRGTPIGGARRRVEKDEGWRLDVRY
jgi:1-deoxy-D-xylulose-5-phosphate synthase